jgi:D-ribulokinase
MSFVIGVDVGTGSARAGLFALDSGKLVARSERKIQLFHDQPDFYEHSSADIWSSVCHCVRECMRDQPVDRVVGISFDATCSLVVLDELGRGVSVSPSGIDDRNVIVWMDHRATGETQTINQTKHSALRYVGGALSPEMEPPKLLWLKTHLPRSWERAKKVLDLADFLVFAACGLDVRSTCTLVCKWGGYLAHEQRWDTSFLDVAGLSDLVSSGRVGSNVQTPGQCAGTLTEAAAAAMGLTTRVAVGVGIIDAHAGFL